ncbi:hypothetical protein [Actinomadura geliboluensis]|uniref:hypothetical protein n=1 Tax=Actinomadura geliboluensis TaxID=882440 RepID=UPI00148613DC|nr:hypothetical protein [Actinomadura geliboluensis]
MGNSKVSSAPRSIRELVGPTRGYPAGALNDRPDRGLGQHWWYQLPADDLTSAQLSATIGLLTGPDGW